MRVEKRNVNYSNPNWRTVLLVGNTPSTTSIRLAVARPTDYMNAIRFSKDAHFLWHACGFGVAAVSSISINE
ncbi:hypothetical protein BofuT4_uP010220.1 [Botrytis cinerea T4]|uniref:Uncharacterized protein n=1 Tax=Botryotinia fuckeliana (strain T4) TaxID=999810 RepID=G2XT60_BOTF4|nr:hypothetical protein BofuT4_uP010220.1 [Botrytis cinerea T4]